MESFERKRESSELTKIVINASEDNVKAWMGRKESDRASGSRETTDEGFPADRLDESVDDLSNQLCPHFGASYHGWISIHARLPCTALTKHCRHRISATLIRLVVRCAVRYFLYNI